jgi:tRNA(Ile)-lysidine synthase
VSGLSERVARSIKVTGALPDGSRILVAVSGGCDSMVLLHLLQELASIRNWILVVAHLNHQLRGRSSDADERLVKARCRALGLPCVVARRDVRGFARRRRLSLEMAAREVRYRFLSQVARRRRCRVIALAHQADDQAELVLLRLLRGSGSDGLGGMSMVGPSPADPEIRLVRPLLESSRAAIEGFARQERIRFRTDRSNSDRRFLRNRIRHELLPLLREHYQPAIDRVLMRTASILAAESDCVSALAGAWLKRPRESFDRLSRAVQRRALQIEAIDLGCALDFEACERLVREPGRPVNIPGGVILSRGRDGRLRRVCERRLAHSGRSLRLSLAEEGRARFAQREFEWRREPAGQGSQRPLRSNREYFDADRVGATIRLRHWRAGDRFQPIGMATAVKLQDLFTNQKVPVAERRRRVVAESASGEIFWVEGMRIGERFKLRVDTCRWLIWQWKEGNSSGCGG